MNTGHRLPPHIVGHLNDAVKSAKLGTAWFDDIQDGPAKGRRIFIQDERDDAPRQVFEGSITDFIRERVRLHHGSWIVGPIEQVLEWSASVDDGSLGEYRLTDRLLAPLPHPQNLSDAARRIKWLEEKNDALEGFLRDVFSKGTNVKALIDALNEQDIPA